MAYCLAQDSFTREPGEAFHVTPFHPQMYKGGQLLSLLRICIRTQTLLQFLSLLTFPDSSRAWCSVVSGSKDPEGQAGSKRKKPASEQLCNLAGPTWSLSDPRLCTCLPLLCLFFKMLKTCNKKQIQNAVINSQFQANQASLLINLNTCKKNNKFCPSLVLRWSLYILCVVCMHVGKRVYIYIYFPLFPIQGGAE